MIDRRYPIGKMAIPDKITAPLVSEWIDELDSFPKRLREVVATLKEEQLNSTYREGGWTIRQVIHHLPDSHMNAYIRVRLALTEDLPTVKSYEEDRWAELSDARTAPVESSVNLLEGLQQRWVLLLRSLSPDELKREMFIPYFNRNISIEYLTGVYAWHGKHHLAQIELVK